MQIRNIIGIGRTPGAITLFPETMKTLTVASAKMPATETNFPVLVDITDVTLKTLTNGGKVASTNGYDIRFFADTTEVTKLDWEVEKYDGSAGRIIAWVRIPSCGVGTSFYMFYGNPAITTDQSNKTGVWNSNFLGVWHFGDGTTLSTADSTSHANNGSLVGTGVSAATGKISGGVHNFSNTDYISLPNPSTYPITTAWTTYCWYFPTLTNSLEVCIFYGEQSGNGVTLLMNGDFWRANFWGGSAADAAPGSVDNTQFQLLTGTFDGTNLRFYKNGSLAGGPTAATPGTSSNPVAVIGNAVSLNWPPLGTLDECRILNTALSANWLLSEYNNQSSPGTFLTVT